MKFRYKILLFIVGIGFFTFLSRAMSQSTVVLNRFNTLLMWLTFFGILLFWFWPVLKPYLADDEVSEEVEEANEETVLKEAENSENHDD